MDGLELLAIIRDLSIIFFMLTGVLVMVIITIAGLIIYRKISPTIDSAHSTLKSTEETAKLLSENFFKPIITGSLISFTTSKIVAFLLGRNRGKRGNENGEQ